MTGFSCALYSRAGWLLLLVVVITDYSCRAATPAYVVVAAGAL
jgi:hypothetical protein